jgi:uncharacterized protein (DUF924 family)
MLLRAMGTFTHAPRRAAAAAAAAAAVTFELATPNSACCQAAAPNGTWSWPSPLPASSVARLNPEVCAVLSHWYCRRFDGSLPPGLSTTHHDPRTDCRTPSTAPEEQLIKAQWVSDDSGWGARMKTPGSDQGLAWWRGLHERAKAGSLDEWAQRSAWETLALVLLLDQVPRALYDGPEIL